MENDYETKSAEKVSESVVTRELSILGKSVSELLKNCEVLEDKLGGVLRASPKVELGGTPEEELTSVPNEIRHQRKQVEFAISALRSILSRIEL